MPFKVISVKQFTYRGAAEQWSNGYTLSGTAPATPEAWDALFEAIWAGERIGLLGTVSRVHAYGYEGLGPPSVRGMAYDPAPAANKGTLSQPTGAIRAPGDVAAIVRFRCGQTVTGKPRYVIKYYHGIAIYDGDDLPAGVTTALANATLPLTNGTLPGGVKLCAPDGTVCGAPDVRRWSTIRQLKRRGKRPQTP